MIEVFLQGLIYFYKKRHDNESQYKGATAFINSLTCFFVTMSFRSEVLAYPTMMQQLNQLGLAPVPCLRIVENTANRLGKGDRMEIAKTDMTNTESAKIRFSPPESGECIDHYVFFVIHMDGIQCYDHSQTGNEFLCVTMELVNCNEVDRTARGMTLFSCLIQKRDDEDSMKRLVLFMDEYIKMVTLTGKKGVFFRYGRQWHHWRWAILGICADSVAEEQIIEAPNKKNSREPCVMMDCRRMKLNMAEYFYQPFESPRVICNKSDQTILGQSLNCFHPFSGYRLMSIVAHAENPIQLINDVAKENETALDDEQRREVASVKSLFERFPKGSLRQWMPVLTLSDFMNAYRHGQMDVVFNENQKKIERYLCSYSPLNEKVRNAFPEKQLLVPEKMCFVADFMHLVCNVWTSFLNYLGGKRKGDEESESFFNGYFSRALYGDITENFNLYSLGNGLVQQAAVRINALTLPSTFSWLQSDCILPAKNAGLKTHDRLLLAFSLFPYLFQDALHFPAVFAMKNILDSLSWMYLFDESYSALATVQSNLFFFCGLLQGEVNPGMISPSIHRLDHCYWSIICHGSPAVNNSFNQENQYRLAKTNVGNSSHIDATLQKRIIAGTACALLKEDDSPRDDMKSVVRERMNDGDMEALLLRTDKDIYGTMTAWNVNDDSVFYHNDSIPVKTMLDCIVAMIKEGKTREEIRSYLATPTGMVMKKKAHLNTLGFVSQVGGIPMTQ